MSRSSDSLNREDIVLAHRPATRSQGNPVERRPVTNQSRKAPNIHGADCCEQPVHHTSRESGFSIQSRAAQFLLWRVRPEVCLKDLNSTAGIPLTECRGTR